jgi:regulatory protein YycH of two-component signal transduction system YycFG
MNSHLHKYRFDSEISQESGGHSHIISGRTDYMIGVGGFHFHYFYDISSYNGHTHYYSGITGLPVKTENGHVHKMDSLLEINNSHEHTFSSFTFEEIEYIRHKKSKEAFA